MVSAYPPISNSSWPLYRVLVDRSKGANYNWYHQVCNWYHQPHQLQLVSPSAPITIGITVTVLRQGLRTCLFFRFLRCSLCCSPERKNPLFSRCSFFVAGRLAGIRRSVRILKSLEILCASLTKTDSGLGMYHLVVWSNFNFFENSQWLTFPTQSCLVCNIVVVVVTIVILFHFLFLFLFILLILFIYSFSWLFFLHIYFVCFILFHLVYNVFLYLFVYL